MKGMFLYENKGKQSDYPGSVNNHDNYFADISRSEFINGARRKWIN